MLETTRLDDEALYNLISWILTKKKERRTFLNINEITKEQVSRLKVILIKLE